MKNRKNILISLGVIILFVLVVYQIMKQYTLISRPRSPEGEVTRALTEFKKALKARDIHKLWEGISKYPQERAGKEEAFKEGFEKNLAENPDYAKYEHEVFIDEVKMITPYRAWVVVHHPMLPKLKQYYMVKENGKWKRGGLGVLLGKVNEDQQLILGGAIREFYADNGHLPYGLSELIPEYIESLPLDPFSDENKTYSYEVTGDKTWRTYSVGLDSRDDLGIIKCEVTGDPYGVEFCNGDIVIEGGI